MNTETKTIIDKFFTKIAQSQMNEITTCLDDKDCNKKNNYHKDCNCVFQSSFKRGVFNQ